MLIGIDRDVRRPCFLLKTLLLVVASTLFFIADARSAVPALALVAVLNIAVLGRIAVRNVRILVVASLIISLMWYLFAFLPQLGFGRGALAAMLRAPAYHVALLRLWGLFLTGQLYLGVTSRFEIMVSLQRVHAPISLSLFVVVMFNAVSYFIQSFRDIHACFYARIPGSRRVRDRLYMLNSLLFDAFRVIFECRKVFLLSKDRVYASLGAGADAAGEAGLPRKGTAAVSDESPAREAAEPLPLDAAGCLQESGPLLISYRNVRYPYAEEPVLVRAEFEFACGVTALVGANGSGKSTLLNLIAGVIPQVIPAAFDEVSGIGEERRRRLGYVPQGSELAFFYDTVSRALCHLPQCRARRWMERFGLGYLLQGERVLSDLSAGECKAIALIAELLDPAHDMCLLDEPSAFLSETLKRQLISLLDAARREGKRILIATHDLELVDVADTVLSVEDGVLRPGRAPARAERPRSRRDAAEHAAPLLATIRVPQPLRPHGAGTANAGASWRTVSLHASERVGICGGNGAGKTTLGTYILDHCDGMRTVMMWQALEKQFFTSTVADELLVGLPRTKGSREAAERALRALGMEGLAARAPQFLSGGEKRALLVLCLVMQQPDVLILDEAFDSVDERRATLLAQLINRYQQESGCCCIFIDQEPHLLSEPLDTVYTIRACAIEG